ncbi:filamentous hemagglutinin family outer membrane protein [Tolypothrix tenuis PCC 7101]|uniref:Filamentous hemagglutinin family outer membrane protein n=1 Tax=Tolypothrix tenuis PCC 7101 TaxID=231146 RepID=A0A1Z4N5H5_9CYAN|nr:filamentous hemagglutinin N-terminal domain-containing protein [Aulosira sp. FACHB-113]BAZ00945.1 filamentous hemagglutinin family outer membrane protein [Tolypothrix tenuis PCC 7101]BAZ75132.1 filamentous hemagglutinin family outer membrane protein [Aulosira laxa NIES-50]
MKVVLFLLKFTSELFTLGIILLVILLWNRCANAQVISDGTTDTIVKQSGNNFNILNGSEKGNNLFHSFSNFSIPQNGSATFDLIHTPNITTIFSRVTGGKISDINGLIQTLNGNHPVSLFLMNPAGIVFGQNASLNIGGSFVGTTANSIKFADGVEFSAVNPAAPPLLTMTVPIGLQLGPNSQGITVQGNGHRLISGLYIPTDRSQNPIGLQVKAGNTLALIGGDVKFVGGIATVNGGGHIEIGSVSNGQVALNSTGQNWVGDYSKVEQFKDINLDERSLLDASGTNGSIQIQGRNINGNGGNVKLNLHNDLLMRHDSLITATAAGKGNGGNLLINASVIVGLENSDIIANAVQGQGGNIQITTQGIFGLELRPQLTSKSDITASSQFGLNGGVEIKTLAVDPSKGIVALPVQPKDASSLITQGCGQNQPSESNHFIVTGRGGLPQNPDVVLGSDTVLEDMQTVPIPTNSDRSLVTASSINLPSQTANEIIEAQGLLITPQGEILLTAQATVITPHSSGLNAASCSTN